MRLEVIGIGNWYKKMLEDNWHGCHREGWGQNRLRPASFAHPAKNSYGLSVRIYEHALEEGWVKPGDYVVDCFSGIGGFALEAMRHGLNFVGVELEQRFCDMGQGCDCTGISKADWVRFQGRWDKARYKDGRHWCPECVMKAGIVEGERKFKPLPLPGTKWAARIALARPGRQTTMLDAAPSTSYVRNSGKIPCTGVHHYRGNIETWEAQGMPGTAVIVQGDSRRLGEVLAEARLCLSSPPYANSLSTEKHGIDWTKAKKDYPGRQMHDGRIALHNRHHDERQYSADPTNLGNLPDTGFEAALMLGSPPYSPHGVGHDAGHPRLDAVEDKRRSEEGSKRRPAYGSEPGQLAQMSEGDLALALGSPPYIGSLNSPQKCGIDWEKAGRPDRCEPSAKRISPQVDGGMSYGQSDGQLAALPEGSHAEACERPQCCIASPPYAHDAEPHGDLRPNSKVFIERSYSREQGQLAQMPTGDHAAALEAGAETGRAQACISSPPFSQPGMQPISSRKELGGQGVRSDYRALGLKPEDNYGTTPGQLGQQQGSTFWAASRQILEEVYKMLAPGGHCIFVCKRFVRDKKIVEFSTQWAHLCEAVGFKWIHHHKAWLVEDRGAQHTLEGGLEKRTVKRFSFFRRIHAQNFPHLAIEFEDVLCFVKE